MFFLIVFIIFINCFESLAQTQKDTTYFAYPNDPVVLPHEPLILFPCASFSFKTGNISISDSNNKVIRPEEYKTFGIIEVRPLEYSRKGISYKENDEYGLPYSYQALFEFSKPNKFHIKYTPSCDNSSVWNPDRIKGLKNWIGNPSFIVEVKPPTPAIPYKMPSETIFRQSGSFSMISGELRDPYPETEKSYYTHKILLYKGGKTESIDRFGSYVKLDDVFRERENLKTDSIAVVGFYKNNPLIYKNGPARWSTKLTIPKNKLRHTTWGVDDKYRNEISEKNQADRTFKFAYGFVSGGEEIAISPGRYKELNIKCNGITPQYSDNLVGDYIEIEITNFGQSFKSGQDVEITISFKDSFDSDWKYTFYAKMK